MLIPEMRSTLENAILRFGFPPVTFDFTFGVEARYDSMLPVEHYIRNLLVSNNITEVKDSLSNVIYWGFANAGFRDHRVSQFRNIVLIQQLVLAQDLFATLEEPGLIAIKRLLLPQFGMMAFVSKIRMFLDPRRYVVLDSKLLSLRDAQTPTLFRDIKNAKGEAAIRITRHNEACYERWCQRCRQLAEENFPGSEVRAVDVERGIFQLVIERWKELAARIVGGG